MNDNSKPPAKVDPASKFINDNWDFAQNVGAVLKRHYPDHGNRDHEQAKREIIKLLAESIHDLTFPDNENIGFLKEEIETLRAVIEDVGNAIINVY